MDSRTAGLLRRAHLDATLAGDPCLGQVREWLKTADLESCWRNEAFSGSLLRGFLSLCLRTQPDAWVKYLDHELLKGTSKWWKHAREQTEALAAQLRDDAWRQVWEQPHLAQARADAVTHGLTGEERAAIDDAAALHAIRDALDRSIRSALRDREKRGT